MGTEVPVMPETTTGKVLSSLIAVVVGTLSAWLFLDGYFMHAAEASRWRDDDRKEVAALAAANTAQTAAINMNIDYVADRNALRNIDNELFRLEQIPEARLNPQDRAVLAKLRRERQELVDLWNRRGRALR